MNYSKQRRKQKVFTKTKSYRFFNCGVQYICKVTYPVDIPDYRIKECFDRAFVGKRDAKAIHNRNAFISLSTDIVFEIIPAKEVDNV